MQFCLFARFLCVVLLSVALSELVEKYCFFGRFLAVSRVFLSFVCVFCIDTKGRYFWPFLRSNFRCTPNPHGDPHRNRGCLPENFFLKIFSSPSHPPVSQFFIFFSIVACLFA